MSLCVGNGQVAVLTIQLYYLTAVPVSPDNICYLDNVRYVTSTDRKLKQLSTLDQQTKS